MEIAVFTVPEVLMSHAKPRLSPWSRLVLVERVLAGRPAAHVAERMGISRATAYQVRYLSACAAIGQRHEHALD